MDLNIIFEYYCKKCEDTWNNSSVELSENIETYSKNSQKKSEKELDKLIDTLSTHLKKYPSDDFVLRRMWVKKGEVFLQNTLEKDNIFKLEKMDVEDRKKFLGITKQFIRDARKFDDDLPISDIMQAMRNVWISNALQLLFDKEVYYSKANFAYSMLYPYTDNYLDNTNINEIDKVLFNSWLEKRLLGEQIKPNNYHESKVSQMIDYIESVYPREKFKEVYESLLLIFKSQVKSLKQQDRKSNLCEEELLSISIEKGGSSVLVDGYLISGLMTKEEIEFCIGYGFLLQISDDLQDIKEDLKFNHETVMTETIKNGTLDKITNKLINFTIELIDGFKINNKNESVITVIKNDCLMLILFSVVYNAEFFSKEYIKEIEKFIPYTISYSLEIKEKIKEKFKNVDVLNNEDEYKEMIDIICKE
ncbi:flagellar protein FliS [Clostridioides difficile]|nr:flagellar protein FliS [Clostridioides difficile]